MAGPIVASKDGAWSLFLNELSRRSKYPLSYPSFVLFFIGAVFGMGAIGIWLELYQIGLLAFLSPSDNSNLSSLRTAVVTFFPALAGTSCMQIVLEEDEKALKAFALVAMLFMGVLALAIGQNQFPILLALAIGSVACLIALWIWWVANADQQGLFNPDVTIGPADTSAELVGSLDGYQA